MSTFHRLDEAGSTPHTAGVFALWLIDLHGVVFAGSPFLE